MTQVQNEILEDNHSTCSSDDNTIYIVLHNLQNILEYHELIEKEVCPEPSCVADDSDPKEFKYTVKILKKIINKT